MKDISVYERLVGIDACYLCNTESNLTSFFEKFITSLTQYGFRISSVLSDVEEPYDVFCQNINLEKLNNGLILNDISSPETVFYFPEKKNIISICLWLEFDANRIRKIEDVLVKNRNLFYATIYNQYDNKWENEENVLSFEVNNKSLRGKKFTTDIFNKKCIDISQNYGRTVRIDGIGYTAGWKMWFGKDFPKALKEKINTMSAFRKEEIDFDILEIQLFERLITDDFESYRVLQKEFIDLINNYFVIT